METIKFSIIFFMLTFLIINNFTNGALTTNSRSSNSWENNVLQDDEDVGEEDEDQDLTRDHKDGIIDFGEELSDLPLGIPEEVIWKFFVKLI